MSIESLYESHTIPFFGKPAEVFFPVGLSEDYGEIVRARSDVKEYEAGLTQFIGNNLRSSDYFLDVGSQIGLFSIIASLRGVKTFSFEMRSSLVRAHYLTKARNGLDSWLPLNLAVDEGVGIVPYTDDAQFALVGGNSDAREATDTVLSVALDEMDMLISGNSSGIIKMDVEGFEVRALRGARNIISSTRPILCIECHPHPAFLYGTRWCGQSA